MLAVIKKEFKSYFLSPIGYVVIGIFLFVFSVFFYLTTIQYGTVDLGSLYFYTALYGLIIIAPILTMRMFAEERKNGTEQLLLTSPLSITKIVLGKFIAALSVAIITAIFTLMYFAILCYFGMPQISTAIAVLIGFVLFVMAYISFGMLASSITENQIIAAIISIAFFIITWVMPDFNSNLQSFSFINMLYKYTSGQIDIADTVTYITFTIACILLTIIVMQRRKSAR